MEIINGLDGQYVISKGKLVKVVEVKHSRDWTMTTGGWIEYTLENGMVYREKYE